MVYFMYDEHPPLNLSLSKILYLSLDILTKTH